MNLARLRRNKGFSQRSFAAAAGVSPSTVFETENGRHIPNPGTVRKFADALGVSPEEVWEAIEAPQRAAEASPAEPVPVRGAVKIEGGAAMEVHAHVRELRSAVREAIERALAGEDPEAVERDTVARILVIS